MSGCNTAAAALLTLAAAACSKQLAGPAPQRPTLAQAYRASGHMAAGDVFVHLFEWKWTDIAAECESVLGPAGFKAVQISPPQEHSIVPTYDWSERYQPVSYSIARSRSGTGAQLDDIFARVNNTLTAEGRSPPYVFLEVIGGSGEALSPRDYFGEGYSSGGAADITEFTFTGVGNKFRGVNGEHISQLNPNGTAGNQFSETAWGLMPSDKAVVFLENHDTQHQCGLSYRDGIVFRLANVWMLAQPYGYPSILSSYAFDCPAGTSMAPPSDANGWTTAVTCAASLETATIGHWVCEHRDPSILQMVSFRHVVAGTNINHWWDNGANAIAFSRGAQGFVAINNETSSQDTTITTGMAPGTYRDLISGNLIQIDAAGSLHLTLASRAHLAIDTSTRQ